MSKPTLFISYSHKDEVWWKDRLRPHLRLLEQAGRIVLWDDRRIDAGDTWYDEIRQAMERAAVAVCLISPDYLASDFIAKEEVPYLLERRARDGMVLLPVLLRPCAWKAVDWVRATQMLPRDGKAVASDFRDDWDVPFAELAEHIFAVVDDPAFRPPGLPLPRWSPPEKVDITRLPQTGAELFGRQRELELLDDAWESEQVRVVSMLAWGGVGKSTLVNRWLERLAADNYRGARWVFGWSFYSQGTGERVTSADLFVSEALRWFGDPDPTAGSPWDKGQRLAGLVRQRETLLVLDGLERLQSALHYERGKINDPALAVLIAELARQGRGLCLITSRELVADLAANPVTTRQENLEQISTAAGRALLRVRGVQGTDAELEGATRDYGHHALAVNLLAAYLHDVPGHHVAHAAEIPDLDLPDAEGRHSRRVMAAFERRFGDGPEVELLRLLGLFDRPARPPEITAVRADPPIAGLTEHLHGLSDLAWLRVLRTLRRNGLIAPESQHEPDNLDAHPLVREHFGQELRQERPVVWREGHSRLYEHLMRTAKELPETLEEMGPLFAAVAHGCQAGRHQHALDQVYLRRIQRGGKFLILKRLGAFGADLAALSGFFDSLWGRPVDGLSEAAKAFVLNEAGVDLRAMGRLLEAPEPTQAGLDAWIARHDWKNAAGAAGNLSELFEAMGDLARALTRAQQSVELADRSGHGFQRMSKRTRLANALHQQGRLVEAEAAFGEAERMQQATESDSPLLYSLGSYLYCDLLLEQDRYEEVQARAAQTLAWSKEHLGLLDIALDHLSLGRACLLAAQHQGTGDIDGATAHLQDAVDGLRSAGHQGFLPLGLLARAELRLFTDEPERARSDLEEALALATRGGMRLHQADCHLAFARLHLAQGDADRARASLATARQMIDQMGYHRRDHQLVELEGRLRA